MAQPDLLRIPYEDDENSWFSLVGHYGKGNQFMAFTISAVPENEPIAYYMVHTGNHRWTAQHNREKHKRWYAVLHTFDAVGNHLKTDALLGGMDAEGTANAIKQANLKLNELISSLGPLTYGDIWVKTFRVEIDDCLFGLIYDHVKDDEGEASEPVEEDEELDYILLEPNDVMFHPPWNDGEYST
jgi:hypothetical protein